MSRARQQARKEAHERWPALGAFLIATLHGDDRRSVEDDLSVAIAAEPLARRTQIADEWWRWNMTAGAVDDVRFAIEAFDSGLAFGDQEHARAFMNTLYDELVTSVRGEVGYRWKPAAPVTGI